MKTATINLKRAALLLALAGSMLTPMADADELGALIQKAGAGDLAAYEKLLSTGFQTHELLKRGPAETADVRKRLRADLRKRRDDALRQKGLVVHEWGASRFVLNARNEIIDTAPESFDDLPSWVHVWSRQPRIGHTEFLMKPVLHFYAERPVSVNVSVRSRDGMLTQWWPNVTRFSPLRPRVGQDAVWRSGGSLSWASLLINPFDTKPLMAAPEGSWWQAARAIDSSPVVVNGGTEKFLFYRGVSRANPLVSVTVNAEKVTVKNPGKHTVKSLYVVSVRDGRMRFHALSTLGPNAAAVVDSKVLASDATVDDTAPRVSALLQEALEEEGLYSAEAKMVVGIWQEELFRSDGVRVIYVRPTPELTASLSLSISPKPASLARAFFAYVECLSPMGESEIKALIADLAAEDFERREHAQAELIQRAELCRELLKSSREAADDPEVQTRLDQILSTARSPEPVDTF